MALHWDMTAVAQTTREAADEATIQAIVFGCIPVGIGTITADNAGEWYARHRLWSLAHELESIPRGTVEAFIGLKTNVNFEPESRIHWIMRVIEPLLDELIGDKRVERDPPSIFAVSVAFADGDGVDEYQVDRALRAGIKREWPEEPDMVKVEEVRSQW